MTLSAAPIGIYGGGIGRGDIMFQSTLVHLAGQPLGFYGGGTGCGDFMLNLSAVSFNGKLTGLYSGGAGRGDQSLEKSFVTLFGDQAWVFTNVTDDSLWTNAANWSYGIPNPLDEPVYINGRVKITTAVEQAYIIIHEGSNNGIIIEPTGSLWSDNGFTNKKTQPSVNDLLIKSSAAGTGSAIFESNNVQGIMQRYLPGAAGAWHMISSPVSDVSFGSFVPDTNEDVYLWHEASPGIWVNYKNNDGSGGNPTFPVANGGTMNMSSGRGYLANYKTANLLKTFESGTFNTGVQSIVLSKSTTKDWSYSNGWNLIGNPYPSALNWAAAANDNASALAEAYAQVYDQNKAGGAGYIQASTIAPGQGFFVLASANSTQINLGIQHQTIGGDYYKGATLFDELIIRLSKDNLFDETKLVVKTEATLSHDFWDGTKMFSFDESIPQLYTLTNGSWPLSIQSIPQAEIGTVIPLAVKTTTGGQYRLSIESSTGNLLNRPVVIRDLLLNVEHQLNTSDYNFMHTSGNPAERFEILFGLVGEKELSRSIVKAFALNGQISLFNLQTTSSIKIVDAMGRLVYSAEEIEAGSLTINTALPKGIYVIAIESKTAIDRIKIIMQ